MLSDTAQPRPLDAISRITRLQALDLILATCRSPTIVIGGSLLLLLGGTGLAQNLSAGRPSDLALAGAACGLAGALARAAAHVSTREREGPFGALLMRPRLRLVLGARRAVASCALLWMAFFAVTALARPDDLAPMAVTAGAGVLAGWMLGVLAAAIRPPTPDAAVETGAAPRGLTVWIGRVLLGLLLIFGVHRMTDHGLDGAAQSLALLAVLILVAPTLPIESLRLNLLAQTPLPLWRILVPLAATPAAASLITALPAGLATGLPPISALGVAAGLALTAGAVRMLFGLAAVGRTNAAGRLAGMVELAAVGLIGLVGPAALIWIVGRPIWLWRRAERVRWRDAGETR